MSKKNDRFYFDNFIECAGISCEAARMLSEAFIHFDPEQLVGQIKRIHEIEHRGDLKKHEMTRELVRTFITPIEREDIVNLSQNIDEVTDLVEDVLLRMYLNNICSLRSEAPVMADLIIRACEAMKSMMVEFSNFKRSVRLTELIVTINQLEEEGDRLFIDSMRRLHTEKTSVLEIITWRDVFQSLEKCLDACEHTADVIESIVMKNT